MKRLCSYARAVVATALMGGIIVGAPYILRLADKYTDRGQGIIQSFAFDDNRDGLVSEEEMRKYHPHFRQDSENNLENNIVYNKTEN